MKVNVHQAKTQSIGLGWIWGMMTLPEGSGRALPREGNGVLNGECGPGEETRLARHLWEVETGL